MTKLYSAMESTVDSYLHKKFKKQLSCEPRRRNEVKHVSQQIDQNEEKETLPLENSHQVKETFCLTDNTYTVPNISTNIVNDSLNARNESSNAEISKYDCSNVVNDSLGYNAENLNDNKSSISLENPVVTLQSPNISYISNIHRYEVNFDTKFSCSDVVSNSHGQKSSILDTNLCKYNYVKSDDNVSPEREQNQDVEKKTEEIPVQSDKSTGGKYVCNYCSLVCSKPSVLQKHIRAHTNERPFPCISCGFSFKTKSNLYKHCRSRTHNNRVLGVKARGETLGEESENNATETVSSTEQKNESNEQPMDYKTKLYKPRFHTASKACYEQVPKENVEDENEQMDHSDSDILSHHINELITKNHSKINPTESYLLKRRLDEYSSEYAQAPQRILTRENEGLKIADEPLNLTNKVRKRCLSEAVESKSLIKEILLKNLASDMQCPHCKMLFQTVTELELHKLRNCKGFVAPGAKYARSSSVNVASILTHNKNAFDSMPQMQTVFPLKSPGPFLGKTRLVDSDKTKSFSFDDSLPNISMYPKVKEMMTSKYVLPSSPLHNDTEKKVPVKLFGGELKISESAGDNKNFRMENNNDNFESASNFMSYGGKMSENRVIKSSLHSGGTVLTNKGNFDGESMNNVQNVLRMYETCPNSSGIDNSKRNIGFNSSTMNERKKPPDLVITFSSEDVNSPSPSFIKYTNILDFSQNAVKLLTPNIKHPMMISGFPASNKFTYPASEIPLKVEVEDNYIHQNLPKTSYPEKTSMLETPKLINKKFQFSPQEIESQPTNMYNPMNIVVNGKVVRYVPGMPGPIVAEAPTDPTLMKSNLSLRPTKVSPSLPKTSIENPIEKERVNEECKRMPSFSISKLVKPPVMEQLEIKTDLPSKNFELSEMRSPVIKLSEVKSPLKVTTEESKKFARPNSLALKPTSASMKQHHGLTPTLLNQILISPDTPRVAKKYVQHYLNGNYFSFLGLKSSTKTVYCTLNKTQPSYVPHFKKLSMYSEWRQQDTKTEKFYTSEYDSRQKSSMYTVAKPKNSDLMVHSSYKFVQQKSIEDRDDENQKPNSISGGYECNDDYIYIRGRGRGKYVCEQCGIRCKKPSMLKKHLRTHSDDRPYTCSCCNFSFKTKGNLTKHMKSKSHNKNSTTSVGSNSSTQQSGTPSSDSETEDSGMDSSDESTRQQEHEAAYGLLSLSQKSTYNVTMNSFSPTSSTNALVVQSPHQVIMDVGNRIMNTEEIAFVTKTNYAKNKCLEQPSVLKLNIKPIALTVPEEKKSAEENSMTMMLGKSCENRPLTYPYIMSDAVLDEPMSVSSENTDNSSRYDARSPETSEPKCITQFHVIQRYASNESECSAKEVQREYNEAAKTAPELHFPTEKLPPNHFPSEKNERSVIVTQNLKAVSSSYICDKPSSSIKISENVVFNGTYKDSRKRHSEDDSEIPSKVQKLDGAIDLSVNAIQKHPEVSKKSKSERNDFYGDYKIAHHRNNVRENNTFKDIQNVSPREKMELSESKNLEFTTHYPKTNGNVLILKNVGIPNEDSNGVNANLNLNFVIEPQTVPISKSSSPKLYSDIDNSAMETLADIATKQVKLEKNAMAKSVASEYLKLATKNEFPAGDKEMFHPMSKEVNDLIVKPEGNKRCTICFKSFNKPSQLKLHMNVHYLERPFRCEPCAVSFRTKGHLQKHERSASHHNKLSSSPAQSSSEPRPFKCTDCNIAFRIHGHLAKHLRSKMHIMKLECLAKIPFGLYAELERSTSLLTEINTADGDQCLDSLKTLAKKVFMNDPAKLKNLVKSPLVEGTE